VHWSLWPAPHLFSWRICSQAFCSWKESTVVVWQCGRTGWCQSFITQPASPLCNSTCAKLSSCRGGSLAFTLDWVSHRVIDSIAHIVRWDAVITAFVARLLPFSHHCYFLNCSPVVGVDRLLVAAVLLPSFWLHLICDGGKWQPSGTLYCGSPTYWSRRTFLALSFRTLPILQQGCRK